MTSRQLRLVEVAPRDGLQNEPNPVPLRTKVAFVNALSEAGLREIEVGSFVSPTAVPQMADSDKVFKKIKRKKGVVYSGLVPNEQGLERALAAKVDKIAVFTAASESFNKKNINATIAQSIDRFRPVVLGALKARVPVRGYISTAFHCPYEGKIAVEKVVAVVDKLCELGVEEISLGDTIGKAAPHEVKELLESLLERLSAEKLYLHLHDTYGLAIANALSAYKDYGVTGFDASTGGLGGCPYAPGATGNVAMEDLAFAFEAEGAETGLNFKKLKAATKWIAPVLGHPPASRQSRLP